MPPEWMEELEHLIRLRRFVKTPGGYVNRGMILQSCSLIDNIGRSSYRGSSWHACGILSVVRFILTKSNLITIREN